MKKRTAIVFVLIIYASSFLGAQVLGQTAATVNLTRTVGITKQQVDRRLEELKKVGGLSGIPSDRITRKQVLDSLISEILIKQAADRDSISVNQESLSSIVNQQKREVEVQLGRPISLEEFQSVIQRETGYSWADYREQLESQLLQQTYITQKKRDLFQSIDPPTQREVEALYRENATSFTNPEYVRISQIFVQTAKKTDAEVQEARAKIEDARKKFRSGEMSFDDLVLKYSEDENSRFRGGDVGFVTVDNQQIKSIYGRDFVDSIFKLDEGEVSGIIESNVGFHIVKATEHQQAKILSLDDPIAPDNPTTVREYLRNRVFQERQQEVLQRATREVIEELQAEAEIVRYD